MAAILFIVLAMIGVHHDSLPAPHAAPQRNPVAVGVHRPVHARVASGGSSAQRSVVSYARVPYSCTALEHLWITEGGSPEHALEAAAEAKAESGGRWWASHVNVGGGATGGSVDRGLWQINSYWFPALSTHVIPVNTRAAIKISGDGSNWQPWSSYDEGAEIGLCGFR